MGGSALLQEGPCCSPLPQMLSSFTRSKLTHLGHHVPDHGPGEGGKKESEELAISFLKDAEIETDIENKHVDTKGRRGVG